MSSAGRTTFDTMLLIFYFINIRFVNEPFMAVGLFGNKVRSSDNVFFWNNANYPTGNDFLGDFAGGLTESLLSR